MDQTIRPYREPLLISEVLAYVIQSYIVRLDWMLITVFFYSFNFALRYRAVIKVWEGFNCFIYLLFTAVFPWTASACNNKYCIVGRINKKIK